MASSTAARGAGFVINQRREDGIEKAKNFCNGRPVLFVDEERITTQTTGITPVTETAYHSGTVYSGSDSASYRGTSTYTTYQPTTYTWNRNYVPFICSDGDIENSSYQIYLPKNGAPICKKMANGYQPGVNRISRIKSLATTIYCVEKQGGLSYLDDSQSLMIYLFLDEKGKQLCHSLEKEMIDDQISIDKVNLWLRKRLVCK